MSEAPGPQRGDRYCIIEGMTGQFVERLRFDDCGVGMEFTRDAANAARVSVREAADGIAKAVPGGKVLKWKPTQGKTL